MKKYILGLLITAGLTFGIINQVNADYYTPNTINFENGLQIMTDIIDGVIINDQIPNFTCGADNCCLITFSDGNETTTLTYCEDTGLTSDCDTRDEEGEMYNCGFHGNVNITYPNTIEANGAFLTFSIYNRDTEENLNIIGTSNGGGGEGGEGGEGGDNSGNDLISSAGVIINGLENTVYEVIPYIVYIGLGVLGLIIGFVAIRWLINFVRNNVFKPFR